MKTILPAVLISLTLTTASFAQPDAPSNQTQAGITLSSWQDARAVLSRALEAAGGEAAIRRLRNVSLEYTGHRNMINQSRRASPPWDREPATGSLIVDRVGRRLYADNFTHYPGIGRFGGAWALKGDEGAHWEPDRNHHGSELMVRYSAANAKGPWTFVPRWIPAFMLLDAWDSGTYVRSLGETARAGRPMKALAWTQRDGAMITMLFDSASGAINGYESIHDDGVFGDVTSRIEFSGWRLQNGVQFPTRRVDWFNAEIARDLRLEFRVDTALDDRRFEVPAGYADAATPADEPRLKKLAEGVYLDTHIGGIMIVEFRDFLVVVECPGDFAMSNATIEALRESFPGKPVRYVVPSHTHGDHGGGARAYFHAGATLLTTPGHVDFYRRLSRVERSIAPDPYRAKDRAPSIEVFRGRREISDGEQTLVLHDIGPNAHSEELTIAHLPAHGIVWQADVYFSPGTGGGVNAAMPIGIAFAQKLKSLGIDDFRMLIEAHNSRVVGPEEFRRAVELGARKSPIR